MKDRIRQQVPDSALDTQEHQWWNEYSDVIERVWANNPPAREALRSEYLDRAKEFLLDGAKDRPLVIELGCGSGWVGHAIARNGEFSVLGIDLSESQIKLANENAVKAGLSQYCTYRCMNLSEVSDLVKSAKNYSGVLIHAILHHLTWNEIHQVLATVRELRAETKLYIYEPITFPAPKPTANPLLLAARWAAIGIAILGIILVRVVDKFYRGQRDTELVKTSTQMFKLAADNNWVLSPKEIVFSYDEMHTTLSKYFSVRSAYLCNYLDTIPAFLASLSKDQNPPWMYTKVLTPLMRIADKLLFKTGALTLVSTYHQSNGFLKKLFPPFGFYAFECENKATK